MIDQVAIPRVDAALTKFLAAEKDFHDQKGRLQEEVENLGYCVLFYPKFHCKLNPIERY